MAFLANLGICLRSTEYKNTEPDDFLVIFTICNIMGYLTINLSIEFSSFVCTGIQWRSGDHIQCKTPQDSNSTLAASFRSRKAIPVSPVSRSAIVGSTFCTGGPLWRTKIWRISSHRQRIHLTSHFSLPEASRERYWRSEAGALLGGTLSIPSHCRYWGHIAQCPFYECCRSLEYANIPPTQRARMSP